ncbi:solute carrier family 16 member 6a [Denticeps clupeoides]|uniref:Monocarboxylate transporter 7 n=1 Tax=Denticeps clupeoides TaxID=299321 RepID=A0AAY4CDJ2_9TELE|nr:monocarboxylate transporter 7-like [Denticeps clupeoides]
MTVWLSRIKSFVGPNVYTAVPDGGWGWVVAVAFFLVELFTYGVIKSFGIFLKDLMTEFDESNTRVSWIVSICVFVMTFTAPLSSVMSNRFGFQPVVMFGGFLISLGTISSAFTTSIDQMYITIGVIAGLGYCLTFLPTVTLLSLYFSQRRSIVTAMASTGESFAIFTFAPAFTALKGSIGWRHTIVVIGLLQGTIIVCGALLRPIVIDQFGHLDADSSQNKNHQQGPDGILMASDVEHGQQAEGGNTRPSPHNQGGEARRTKLLDLSMLKQGSFICYSAFGLFATLGFFAPQLYVVELSTSHGVDRDKAAYTLSAMAIAEIFGRLTIGWIMSWGRVRKIFVLLACVLMLGAVLVLFALVKGLWAVVACCILYGFLLGNVASTHIPMLAEDDVVGIQLMPSAVGIYVGIQSFAGLAGPPLGGVLVDITQNYGSAFYSCAAGMALGALFLGLVLPAKSSRLCLKKSEPGQRDEAVAVGELSSNHLNTGPRSDQNSSEE